MEVKRSYFLGENWLYFKIYCGPKTADNILTNVIKPASEFFLKNNQIDQWFFIRYSDPDAHLRVRFHMPDTRNIGNLILSINQLLKPFLDSGLVFKLMTDTYNREMERYGEELMPITERMFYNDSRAIVNMIDLLEGEEGERLRWGIGLYAIDALLNDFGYTLEQKFNQITRMRDDFAREHGVNQYVRPQLTKKHRREKNFINSIFKASQDENSEYKPLFDIIHERSELNQPIVQGIFHHLGTEEITEEMYRYMWSYLHMFNNRLFRAKQRTHELLMYFFLQKYYRSQLARAGVKVKELEDSLVTEEKK